MAVRNGGDEVGAGYFEVAYAKVRLEDGPSEAEIELLIDLGEVKHSLVVSALRSRFERALEGAVALRKRAEVGLRERGAHRSQGPGWLRRRLLIFAAFSVSLHRQIMHWVSGSGRAVNVVRPRVVRLPIRLG